MRRKTLGCGAVLACAVLALAGLTASADEKKNDPAAPSGVWVLKGGETTIEFAGKDVMKLHPHGEKGGITIVCKYTAKEGRVKGTVSDFEGKEEFKAKVKEILPVGLEFSFRWQAKGDAATLDELKGDKAEGLKSHLEGQYERKK
jgi:hypothetical protein